MHLTALTLNRCTLRQCPLTIQKANRKTLKILPGKFHLLFLTFPGNLDSWVITKQNNKLQNLINLTEK